MRMLGYICMRNRKRRSCEHVTFLVSLWTISQTILLCVPSPSSHYVCALLLPANVNLSRWFWCGKFVITKLYACIILYEEKIPIPISSVIWIWKCKLNEYKHVFEYPNSSSLFIPDISIPWKLGAFLYGCFCHILSVWGSYDGARKSFTQKGKNVTFS